MAAKKSDILVIDDTPHNLRLLHDLLTSSGYVTRSAPNGRLGLQAARLRKPDLILLDIAMPEMDGLEVCRILKADEGLKDVPVLFISASGSSESIVKAFTSGGVDYVTKPFELEEVEARIGTHLRLRELQEQLKEQNRTLEAKVDERTRELREANERLQSLDELKRGFFTMISHELRTPLNGVFGVTDLIVYEREHDELSDSYQKSRQRVLRLIDQFSEIAELELADANDGLADSFNLDEALALFTIVSSADQLEELRSGEDKRLKGDFQFVAKAFQIVVEMVRTLNGDGSIRPVFEQEECCLRIRFPIESSNVSKELIHTYLSEDVGGRQSGPLECMGLEPVIALKLVELFGGKLVTRSEPAQELVLELSYV